MRTSLSSCTQNRPKQHAGKQPAFRVCEFTSKPARSPNSNFRLTSVNKKRLMLKHVNASYATRTIRNIRIIGVIAIAWIELPSIRMIGAIVTDYKPSSGKHSQTSGEIKTYPCVHHTFQNSLHSSPDPVIFVNNRVRRNSVGRLR